MKLPAIIGFAISLALSGCSFELKINEKNETVMGSHPVVVKPGSSVTSSSSSSGGDTEIHRYRSGEVIIEIKNDQLTVNDVRYGALAPGVEILVDHGTVFIGGEEREGTPMTPREIMDAAPEKETVIELDGYEVTVRPGSSFTTKSSVFGRQTLTVGKTKVSVKDDELFINETSHGSLKAGDTILVDQGSVTVSGERREPN